MQVVKEDFTCVMGRYPIHVPAGARTEADPFDKAFRWVAPSTFPRGSLERHDATYRGIRVPLSNTVESHRND
jgi:hypothetical protein